MPTSFIPSTMSQKHKAKTPFEFDGRDIAVSKLLLDPNNYRFFDRKKFKRKAATRLHEDSVQRATLETLEQSYQVDELKQSILTNGYVPMERIIVVPYREKPGFYTVVEGNRRVASLKSILKEEKEGVIVLSSSQRASFSRIPCAVLLSSGDSLKHEERVIMGIRHIAGPQEWGAYQRALLVSELKDDENLEFKEIGEMLGISSVEAARRYRAIGALKFMEKDDLFSKKAEPAFYRLFHELVSLPDVRMRFGWSSEKDSFSDIDKARQFFELICSDGKEDAKVQTYSDVRKLKNVVGNPKAEASLFDPDQPLSEAFRLADQERIPANASSLLHDAKTCLAGISFLQASKLTPDDVAVVDELVALLERMKQAATTDKTS